MRIIVYAIGKLFEQHIDKIVWEHVVAIVDKEKFGAGELHGHQILCPQAVCDLDYDYIAVFSDRFYEEIRQELVGEYFVSQTKIISWREILKNKIDVSMFNFCFFKKYIQIKDCEKILNIGTSVLSQFCLTKDSFISKQGVLLDVIQNEEKAWNINLFDNAFKNIEVCNEKYDVALIWDISKCGIEEISALLMHTNSIVFFSQYLINERPAREVIMEKMGHLGKCTIISKAEGVYGIIEAKTPEMYTDVVIYVVTHRKYNLNADKLYKPLCVGKYYQEECFSELNGKNIAYLNNKINECTALYWIWKNTTSQYVGLNHYRRYFYNDDIKSIDNYLNIKKIVEIMNNYDIILPQPVPQGNQTVYEQIHDSLDSELFEEGYVLIRNKIEKYQPYYLEDFDEVMNGRIFFWCNMFVTRREILNRYCEWLFSFLIEAAEEINVDGYNAYNQRVIGFFAERMWTVWLRKNKVRIKELPILL